ncbi:MAG: N-acetyl-gamma-glutamyl-phosphate reductase [Candidatus Omnitrophica bacterium]|nr:N-acetyl-gamma-glutamyl-phosphate reductase [Candidatus Omnitrophota bacterium]
MIKVGIIGVSGYSGFTALDILLKHPHVRVSYAGANDTEGYLSDIWPQLKNRTNLHCKKFDIETAKGCDVIFLAVPHTASMGITPKLLAAGLKVIDLSGDYRLNSTSVYEKWYHAKHTDQKNLKKAVYGLPELYRENIRKATLIANPGCYPTAAILGLAPFLATHQELVESIYIDAKSGVSGAGRKASVPLIHAEVSENFKAYKVLNHQHAPEIELYLSKIKGKKTRIEFVPHLLPVNRGILETIYVRLNSKIQLAKCHTIYKKFYKTEPFVRVYNLGEQVELKNVVKTNYCDISLALNADKNLLVITCVIDNLVKGAAGQAVQNMNLMFGFNESEGLA